MGVVIEVLCNDPRLIVGGVTAGDCVICAGVISESY